MEMELEPSLLVSWASIALLALSAVYVLYSTTRSRSALRLPPSPPGWWPVIGHLRLLSNMPHHELRELAVRMRAPLLRLQLGSITALVISKPDLARAALTTNDNALASRPQLLAGQIISFGCSDVTLASAGPYHRMARGLVVSDLMSPRRVATYGSIRVKELRRLLALLTKTCKVETTVDVSRRLGDMINDVFCRVSFGRRFQGEGDEKLAAVFAEVKRLYIQFAVGDFFPELEPLGTAVTGLRRQMKSCLVRLRQISNEFVDDHVTGKLQRIPFAGDDRDEDFIDLLLGAQKSSSTADVLSLTQDNMMAMIVDMFLAGTDSTFGTLEWAMTELVRHPQVLRKAQDEVRAALGSKSSVEESDLGELRYLRAVIKEAFRLHPTVPLLVPRESVTPCTLGGYDIPVKSRIFINTFAMGRDPEIWENPLHFSPERFYADGDKVDLMDNHGYKLLPFGGGRRRCPGYKFGQVNLQLVLASLLFHFDWALPKGVCADDISLEDKPGLTRLKRDPLLAAVVKNSKYEFKGEELDEV